MTYKELKLRYDELREAVATKIMPDYSFDSKPLNPLNSYCDEVLIEEYNRYWGIHERKKG